MTTKHELNSWPDFYGYPITIESLVAFNYSGEVRKGVVKRIVETRKPRYEWDSGRPNYYSDVQFHIQRIDSDGNMVVGAISKIRSARNLIHI